MTAVIDADEFARPETKMILRDEDGQSEERDLTSTDGDELPTRPIDIFRDLGLSEGTIAIYLGRWQWGESSPILRLT
jgi:hypothetical protein